MDWCLDDLHHGCSIPWGKHLVIISLVFVESIIAHRFAQDKKNPNCRLPGKKHIDVVRWSYDIWSYHPIFNLCSFCQSAGSSPCHSSACPIITERRRKEEKWSLHWRWIFILLRIDVSSGWSMFKIIFLSRFQNNCSQHMISFYQHCVREQTTPRPQTKTGYNLFPKWSTGKIWQN